MKPSYSDLALDILESMDEEDVKETPSLSPIKETNISNYVPDISSVDLDKMGFSLNEGSQGLKRLVRKSKGLTKKGDTKGAYLNFKKAHHKKANQEERGKKAERKAAGSLASFIGKRWQLPKARRKKELDENLLRELAQVVKRGKEIIEEMTTCGMIGVNMATKVNKPKKKRKKVLEGSIGLAKFLRSGINKNKLKAKDKIRSSKDPEFKLKRLRGVSKAAMK